MDNTKDDRIGAWKVEADGQLVLWQFLLSLGRFSC